ncbi:hypothetical protein HPB48_016124 [Haemaphysalis longicornis]|uniref:Uncharacterized protein n=1 Tax=Haemaphysalis longicornis TaxID=44386 RepID=A0A9J6GS88_HAELO|nr:hypothetical protein HPB48_016124 [Haemaphysalis longicornis]
MVAGAQTVSHGVVVTETDYVKTHDVSEVSREVASEVAPEACPQAASEVPLEAGFEVDFQAQFAVLLGAGTPRPTTHPSGKGCLGPMALTAQSAMAPPL